MTSDTLFAVHDMEDRPRCWHCGEAPPTVDGRWCSARCWLAGEEVLHSLPTPTEIREVCEKIQAGWSDYERQTRLLAMPSPWSVPVVNLTDCQAETIEEDT